MKPSSVIPSLLVFGPQTDLPSQEVLAELRQELVENPQLSGLKDAVKTLPKFWHTLTDFDPTLRQVPGAKYLGDLQRWIVDGGAFPHLSGNTPNVYALPVTLILQITQYVRYLSQIGKKDPHRLVIEALQAGGIQGFCVGFLSAIAVSTAESEADIAAVAAVSLRFAVSIGAYVDQDGGFAEEPNQTACVSIRWRSDDVNEKEIIDIIRSYPDAYISSFTDDASLSVTARAVDLAGLTEKFQARGLRVKAVPVQGRFHCAVHSSAVDKLTKFAIHSDELRFPTVDKLRTPVRSTVNGEVITEGSLSRLALENTLLKPADWYRTLRAAINQLPDNHKVAAFAGFGNHIPPSLVQNSSLKVLSLSNLESSRRPINSSPSTGLPNGASVNGTYKSTNGILPEAQIQESQYPPHSIAIVGMSGKFPGADSLDELWEILLSGNVMAERAPSERLRLPGPETGDHSGTKWWGNFLRDPDAFDHRFFKKSSREAIAWDPQQRILLEVVYEALESAGYFGATSTPQPDDYGCYIGAVMNNYYDNVSCHPATAYATLGTSRCFLSGCMSHYFGWTGPSLTIDTACSSSLVAINTACRAIWSGECSRAIAGGTNVFTSPFDYQNLRAAGFLSPSGECKPFDADADGYCRGEGVGVVVLKTLADAIKENDNILGVIVGSAANQNQNCSHITVPHSGSQMNLYQKVMNLAGVQPEEVSYVEAHGTGTGVGDPVECQSIREAFAGPSRESTLHFGSIKGNIGHTEATAGIAGLIKVLLMMQHGKIPVQASHKRLNPKIPALEPDHMAIPRSVLPWNPSSRIACVNSYGAAGSNAAVMVRELNHTTNGSQNSITRLSKYPLFISAASASSLSMYCQKLTNWLKHLKSESTTEIQVSDLTFNLADRANHSLSHIVSTTVTDIYDLEEKLATAASATSSITVPSPKPAVLVFGGQESDFIGISEDVYQSSTLFRHHLDACNDILISLGFESLYPTIFQHTPVANLVTLHAALFSVQYASAKSWIDGGLEVSAVVGHSFGQLTALCISGTLSLPDALKLVTGRASIMLKYWGPESGSMIFVQADREKVSEIISSLKAQGEADSVEIACYNGPKSHVVVGSAKDVDALEKFITSSSSLRDSIRTKRLKVTHGFHSKFTEPLLPHLTALATEVVWRRPTIHLETCDDAQSVAEPDFRLVPEHTRRPVFFQQAVERLAQRYSQSTWIEAGRGSSVIQLVRGAVPDTQGHLFLSPQLTTTNAQGSLTDTTVDLWKAGYSVQYWPFHRSQRSQYQYLSLPPYQFEKTRHWLPFTGRGSEKEVQPEPIQEAPTVYELLSFVKFKDDSKKEAVFRIAPQSDRFKSMLGGHVMGGQSLAPASLYFEVASRAALFLESDTTATTYVPTVKDLLMKSPIGLDTTKDILLSLTRVSSSQPSWSFSITTQEKSSEPFEHSTGSVYLQKRDDMQAAANFKRFETLTGHRRYEEIINHPDAEKMQGNHIYRAFNHIVHYAENFRGIKTVACVRMEAAGRVSISVDPNDPPDQRLCDTPMTDSFMQFAGFLVNYFNNPSLEDVLVCMKIEHIEIGGDFNPDAKEWIVYSNMTEGGETDASSDAYIFEAESKKMVMAAFGFRFSKMSQSLLARVLKSVNRNSGSGKTAEKTVSHTTEKPLIEAPESDAKPIKSAKPAKKSSSKRADVLKVLHEVTDVPMEDLKDEATLEDLGIDSLMATEVLNDIRAVLGLTIDLTSFLFFPNIQAMVAHIDSKLGGGDEEEEDSDTTEMDTPATEADVPTSNGVHKSPESAPEKPAPTPQSSSGSADSSSRPTITSAYDSFKDIRLGYDQLAIGTKAINFWTQAYPEEARLVLAYVVEAYAELGCDMKKLQPGDDVPEINALPRHKQLVRQFYRVLEDGHLIISSNGGFVRTDVPVDPTPAETIYQKILDPYPQHANVHKLVKVVGSQLAACLTGEKDGLQLVFGNRENKRTLEDMYENWPLLRTPTLLLGDFLLQAFTNFTGSGKFRILEIGAGTGGTTKYIVNHLKSHGIPFEYTFTDISASLVAAAKKNFKGIDGMKFELLDIEKPPTKEYENAFHVIIATNCIHATRRLDKSLLHLRKMLREDGALTLVEITKNMFWLDIVVGLFEGWWLFEDGRSHALVNEKHWERLMKEAGFKEVLWTDGNAPESKTVRVIGAFPTAPGYVNATKDAKKSTKAALETVVYKKLGDQEICADVYYPISDEIPTTKMPIALMIHGGSHIIFSRKDIRPAQTRLLLEKGFLPVSLDHRLCPEVKLSEGPMVDVCDALEWARYTLPNIKLQRSGLQIDGERVVVVGWSSGGQLAMSLAWTAPQRGLRPPEAILAFYCPTNYEDEWWRHPIQPIGAEDKGDDYDVLEAIQDEPITNYGVVGAWEPLSDPRIRTDPRCRIVLHINWKAQTLPVIIGGLLSKKKAANSSVKDWKALPQPGLNEIIPVSPLAQIQRGNYQTPTFLIHGTADDLIPWQQSQGTYSALVDQGVTAGLVLIDGAPHICDLSSDPESEGWKAALRGYDFISSYVL